MPNDEGHNPLAGSKAEVFVKDTKIPVNYRELPAPAIDSSPTSSTSITISLASPSDPDARYRLLRSTDGGAYVEVARQLEASAFPYVDDGLTAGTPHDHLVEADNGWGKKLSAVKSATTPASELVSVSGFMLSAGHYEPRKFDMVPVFPVDKNDPQYSAYAYAYNKQAKPGQLYECPIVMAGGSYPFKVEIVSAPAWLSVGSFLSLNAEGVLVEAADYMCLSGTPPSDGSGNGTFDVTVRVFDQEYGRGASPSAYKDITWPLTVGDNFFYYATAATGLGDGSSPNDCKLWEGDLAGSVNKVAVLRGGSYLTNGFTANAGTTAMAVMAYPGEAVTMDVQGGDIYYQSDDFKMVGIDFIGAVGQLFHGLDYVHHIGIWRCTDTGHKAGGFSNESMSYIDFDNADIQHHVFLRECTFSNYEDVHFFDWYTVTKTCVERCEVLAPSSVITDMANSLYFPKASNSYSSIRRNKMVLPDRDLSYSGAFQIYQNTEKGVGTSDYHETCYNIAVGNAQSGDNGMCVIFGGSAATDAQLLFSYRNTWVGGFVEARNVGVSLKVYMDSEVIQNKEGGYKSGFTDSDIVDTNKECYGTTGIVDPLTGKLIDAYRTDWLGKRGHEIAGEVT